ncbi:AMP-dependent synthetase/ligase [Namhaeicola litoreus]|uniref:AMP-dependent synthetase/ligase n=1 Tax=Namhaeicola litoreus TaxID=1052145 RepID=A0ABW3Y7E3_9FLAO
MAIEIKRLFDFLYFQLESNPIPNSLNTKYDGKWVSVSSQEFVNSVNQMSRGLLNLGVEQGDKIALISSTNRTEWNILDMAIMQLGAINVPIYPTIGENDYKYIFNHAEVKFCFLSDEKLYEKAKLAQKDSPKLLEIFTFDQVENAKNWKEIFHLGKDLTRQEEVDKLKAQVKAEDLATIIYTSGTTGTPKGVMLTHNNIVTNVIDSTPRLPITTGSGVVMSFLPVCHIFERMLHYLYIHNSLAIYFAESIEKISDNLKEVKPHFMSVVPRLLEKIYDSIVAKGADLPGIKKMIFFWAIDVGMAYEPYAQKSWWYEKKLNLARKLIFSKWKEALGGRLHTMVSGSAPLQPRLTRIFCAADLQVMEGYGLTETSPVVSVNQYTGENFRIGTVGKLINRVEVKIAEDGEILVKGPNVMIGYYKDPEKTAEVMTGDFFHTGDKGEIDSDGFLKITGRKKEIFKTSGGKYIAPAPIENQMKQSRFIEQILVIGEGQKMAAALIQPNFEFVKEWAKRHHIEIGNSILEIAQNSKVKERIMEEVDKGNEQFGKWETIKRIELTPDIWTVDNNLLTPTFKPKRTEILKKYKDLYDKIYS